MDLDSSTSLFVRRMATIDDLAEMAGVSVRAVSRIRTTGRVSVDVADRFAIALGTHLGLLYADDEAEAA